MRIFIPILQMSKLKLTGKKQLALNIIPKVVKLGESDLSAPEIVLLTILHTTFPDDLT